MNWLHVATLVMFLPLQDIPMMASMTLVDAISHVSSRGLRLKVGIDVGAVMDSVQSATRRMAYRGRVMNRAARIACAASSGQVSSSFVHQKCTVSAPSGHHWCTLSGFKQQTSIGAGIQVYTCKARWCRVVHRRCWRTR
jgi:class 3 adenylate cyclase